MSLADAFAGIRGAQTPKRREVAGTQFVSVKGDTRKRQKEPAKGAGEKTEIPRHGLPLQGTAKSRHPEFEAVKVYVRRETRKRAWRKWEDAEGGDFSDLVEMLLEKYLGA